MAEETKIVGRKSSSENMIKWNPAEGNLPMTHVRKGNRFGGAVALLAGIPWLYSSAGFTMEEIGRSGLQYGQFFLFLLVFSGLFVVLFGFSQFIYREETTVRPDMVSFHRQGLGGSKSWQEPLLAYRGILKKQLPWEGEHGKDRMIYTLVMGHDDSEKQVTLYQAESTLMEPPPQWEEQWNNYGNLFRLPLLK